MRDGYRVPQDRGQCCVGHKEYGVINGSGKPRSGNWHLLSDPRSQATAAPPQLQRPLIRSTTHAPDQPSCRPRLLTGRSLSPLTVMGQCRIATTDFHDLSPAPHHAQVELAQREFISACSRSSACQPWENGRRLNLKNNRVPWASTVEHQNRWSFHFPNLRAA